MIRQTRTENGLVRGIQIADPRITVYRGIPFAAPPVGELRWRAPQPAADWEGVRDCFEFAAMPVQRNATGDSNAFYDKEFYADSEVVPMSEDCLYLNIWTPAKTPDEKLPVMVWIYGGAFQNGYTAEMEMDGERIASRGVILVSVAYRVNAFGFMTHPAFREENPGGPSANWGILDQKAGIDWVGRNIGYFGGDPGNITIFGQSAGGWSVLSHMLSPMASGSFHKAIIMSMPPIPLAPHAGNMRDTLEKAEKAGEDFLAFLGVKTVGEARAIDALTLYKKTSESGARFGPTVDGSYITDEFDQLIASGRLRNLPYIISNTTNDFLYGPEEADMESIESWAKDNFEDKADIFLELTKKKAGSGDPQRIKEAAAVNICEAGTQLFLRLCAKNGLNKVYHSRFGPEIPGGDNAGAFHSSDLWFVFETLSKCWRPFKGKHYDLARQMCNYWTNFAKTGDPNGPDADGLPMPEWDPFTIDSKCSMNFTDTVYTSNGLDEWLNFVVDYNYETLFG